MKEVIHIEISKSQWKPGTFCIRIGDIKGSTETSNCSFDDILNEVKWAVEEIIDESSTDLALNSQQEEISSAKVEKSVKCNPADTIHSQISNELNKDYDLKWKLN